jgi:hypothetical protein
LQLGTGSMRDVDDARCVAMHVTDQEVVLRQSNPE